MRLGKCTQKKSKRPHRKKLMGKGILGAKINRGNYPGEPYGDFKDKKEGHPTHECSQQRCQYNDSSCHVYALQALRKCLCYFSCCGPKCFASPKSHLAQKNRHHSSSFSFNSFKIKFPSLWHDKKDIHRYHAHCISFTMCTALL